MPRIDTYRNDADLTPEDGLLGTDNNTGETVNFTLESLATYVETNVNHTTVAGTSGQIDVNTVGLASTVSLDNTLLDDINANTAKTGITSTQATAITTNTTDIATNAGDIATNATELGTVQQFAKDTTTQIPFDKIPDIQYGDVEEFATLADLQASSIVWHRGDIWIEGTTNTNLYLGTNGKASADVVQADFRTINAAAGAVSSIIAGNNITVSSNTGAVTISTTASTILNDANTFTEVNKFTNAAGGVQASRVTGVDDIDTYIQFGDETETIDIQSNGVSILSNRSDFNETIVSGNSVVLSGQTLLFANSIVTPTDVPLLLGTNIMTLNFSNLDKDFSVGKNNEGNVIHYDSGNDVLEFDANTINGIGYRNIENTPIGISVPEDTVVLSGDRSNVVIPGSNEISTIRMRNDFDSRLTPWIITGPDVLLSQAGDGKVEPITASYTTSLGDLGTPELFSGVNVTNIVIPATTFGQGFWNIIFESVNGMTIDGLTYNYDSSTGEKTVRGFTSPPTGTQTWLFQVTDANGVTDNIAGFTNTGDLANGGDIATTFSYDPDIGDAVYTTSIINQAFTGSTDITTNLTQVATAISGLETNFTWDGNINPVTVEQGVGTNITTFAADGLSGTSLAQAYISDTESSTNSEQYAAGTAFSAFNNLFLTQRGSGAGDIYNEARVGDSIRILLGSGFGIFPIIAKPDTFTFLTATVSKLQLGEVTSFSGTLPDLTANYTGTIIFGSYIKSIKCKYRFRYYY